MTLPPFYPKWQCSVSLVSLWKPTIFCFKSGAKVPDKSLSNTLEGNVLCLLHW